jgi:predicted nucleotidyltransferase
VKDGERVIAKGKLEKITNNKSLKSKNRLVVGTTRESIDEYIKLKELKV